MDITTGKWIYRWIVVGAAIATGCVVGNIMSGWALMSVDGFIFGLVTILSNWVTTYFCLMGGRSRA